MFQRNLVLKTVSVVMVIVFLWTNCVWADGLDTVSYERRADTLAARSQVKDALGLARAVYTGAALHSVLITENVKELRALYQEQARIRAELRKKLGEAVDNLKTLIFTDKTDSKKIAYYTFTSDGYFYRFTNADNVDDPFFNLIKGHLASPLDSRAVFIDKNKYNQETLQAPVSIVNLINTCLGELYPDSKVGISDEIKAENLKDEESGMVQEGLRLDTRNLSGGSIRQEDKFTQSDYDGLKERLEGIEQGLKDDIGKLKTEEGREVIRKSWREWLIPWLSGVKGDVDENKLLDYEYWTRNNPVINRIIGTAERVRRDKTEAFVHVGIGGSIIPTRAIVNPNISSMLNQAAEGRRGGSPRVYYTGDSFSPESLMELLDSLEDQGILFKTKFNIISKSGATAETIGTYLVIRARIQMRLEELKKAYDRGKINNRGLKKLGLTRKDITPENIDGGLYFKTGRFFIATTGFDAKSVLYRQFHHKGRNDTQIGNLQGDECYKGTDFDPFYAILPVPEGMGGRFSGFSAVGLLLLAVTANGNIGETPRSRMEEAFRGIKRALDRALNTELGSEENVAFRTAAISHIAEYVKNKAIEVLYFFDSKIADVAKLLDELYSESLQENGKGIDVRPLIGTVDNHMAWNGIIAGPRNKIIRFFMTENYDPGSDPFIPEGSGITGDIQAIEGLRLGSVQNAAVLGTAEDAVWPRRKTKDGEESLPGVLNYTQLLHSRTVANVSDLIFTMMLETAVLGKLNGLQKEIKEDGTVVDLTYLQHWVEGYKEAMRKRCRELKTKDKKQTLRGSHLVRAVEPGKEEKDVYGWDLNENGALIGKGAVSAGEEENIGKYAVMMRDAIDRLSDIYGDGIITRVNEVNVVDNLGGGRLYPQGRAPLASYRGGVLKIDRMLFGLGEAVVFEELEHEFSESIAGVIPGSNDIYSDLVSTCKNVLRFLEPNAGVKNAKYKRNETDYRESILLGLRGSAGKIDPDGEYLALLERLLKLKQGNGLTENEVVASVVRYALRTKLYEHVRGRLGLPEELARKIRDLEPRLDDALGVFNVIAKAKQGGAVVQKVKEHADLTVSVVKTFTGLRISGVENLSELLQRLIAVSADQIYGTDKLAGKMVKAESTKYLLARADRLEELKTALGDEYAGMEKRFADNNYLICISDTLPQGVNQDDIVEMIDPADLESARRMSGRHYLPPMPLTRSALYIAADIARAGGDAAKLDIMVKGFIRNLYAVILNEPVTDEILEKLMNDPWWCLPKITSILSDLNTLRIAVHKIEQAA